MWMLSLREWLAKSGHTVPREGDEGPGILILCVPEREGQGPAPLGFLGQNGPFGPLSPGDAG